MYTRLGIATLCLVSIDSMFVINYDYIRVGSHGIPSPTHVSKSPTFELQKTIRIWLSISKIGSRLFYAKVFVGLGVESWV